MNNFMTQIIVNAYMEESEGAACHGYQEFDWTAYVSFETEDGTVYGWSDKDKPFTEEQLQGLNKIEQEATEKNLFCVKGPGQYSARIDFSHVRAYRVDDFKEEWKEKLTNRLLRLLKRNFKKYEIEENF